MQSRPPQVALLASGTGVFAIVALIAGFLQFGPHTQHMMAHILTMNVAAPILSVIVLARRTRPARGVSLLWLATILQITLLWSWHAPIAQNLLYHAPAWMGVMHVLLLMAAVAFWTSLFSLRASSRWQAIPALLVTGKLVCLLAALLVLAPRVLYGSSAHTAPSLDDQHLAGLLMLAACPFSYLIVAVFLTVHLVGAGEPSGAPPQIQRTVS
ncbi:cytochrome c oxidase assembly protein [Bradyrhizobium sp. OAE829]|uniref:cytochrome c oxidase assembly protein n=1 Tax=Bradyrhizobium sp. OAE829 TaxID=2663807 RepID=UPI001789BAA1